MKPYVRALTLALLGIAAAAFPAAGQRPGPGFPDIDSLLDHPRVAHFLDYFTGPARDRMGQWLERRGSVGGLIRSELAREGLPEEFEYLPLIESGYSNTAVSRAGAVGMWQFIPATARERGLRMNGWVDERRDPARATTAAVRHIRELSERFGSTLLAAAAYNGGAGRVSRGLSRLGPDSAAAPFGDGDFFRLAERQLLARETSDYVPQLIAAAAIGRDPARYGFDPRPRATQPSDSVRVPALVSLDAAARALGLPRAELRALNPQFVRGVTPPGSASWLRVPDGLADTLEAALPSLPRFAPPEPRARGLGALIRVRRGDTVEAIAERHGVSAGALRRANALPAWYRVKPGQALRLPIG